MAQITGGKVTYSRTVQPAQYESKRAEIELSFVLAEGEDLAETLDDVAETVKIKSNPMNFTVTIYLHSICSAWAPSPPSSAHPVSTRWTTARLS